MRKLYFWIGAVMFVSMSFFSCVSLLHAEGVNTPESFTQHVASQPIITKFIEEDEIEEALKLVNDMHSRMAEDGWEFCSLIEFVDDEDFEGFFVTYKKKKE